MPAIRLLSIGLLCTSTVVAQTFTWDEPSGGLWHQNVNWSPNGVPSAVGDSARFQIGGTYTVELLSNDVMIDGFDIMDADATVHIREGRTLEFSDSVAIIQGTIRVGNSSIGIHPPSLLDLGGNTQLIGTGTIELDATAGSLAAAQLRAVSGSTTTIGPGLTINGRGRIARGFINNGTIEAVGAAGFIDIQEMGGGARTNNGTIAARDEGTTMFTNPGTIMQGENGEIVADNAEVILQGDYSGGFFRTFNGGEISTQSLSDTSLTTCTNEGLLVVLHRNTDVVIREPGLTNDGTIEIRHAASPAGARILSVEGDVEVDGTGIVFLNVPNLGATGGAALARSGAAGTLTLGTNQTLIGRGRINVDTTIEGTISPGTTPGEFSDISLGDAALTLAAGSTTIIDIFNMASDEIVEPISIPATSSVVLGGTLEVNEVVPSPVGHENVIIAADIVIGTFDTEVLPPGYVVTYTANSVTVVRNQVVGDMNCDGAITVSDIGPFVLALTNPAQYEIDFPECDINNGDINNDGSVTVSDIGPFVALLTGS